MAIENMTLSDFLKESGVPLYKRATADFLYGINAGRQRPNIPSNKTTYGWTFFTRPQLNLRTANIRNVRLLYPLLNKNPVSMQRYVRVTLDPRLPFKLNVGPGRESFYTDDIVDCPIVDKYNAFIPLLTNTIKSFSGVPDEVVPTWTSSQGIRREQITIVDGTFEILEAYDITCTFQNFANNPILMLFQTWSRYASYVFEGMMSPYWDFVIENEIDYNTRIYRITTGPDWETIDQIFATGASIPVSTPTGKFFDFDVSRPYSDQTKDINIVFKSVGAIINDDILLMEFNKTMAIFNPWIRKYMEGDNNMEVVPRELIKYVNFNCYPYIDTKTYKLKWLVPKTSPTYQKLVDMYKKKDSDIEKSVKNKELLTDNKITDISDIPNVSINE